LTIHSLAKQRVLRAAIVGAGVFGRHHAAKYMRLPGVKLHAVADPSADARNYVETHLKVPVVSDNGAALILTDRVLRVLKILTVMVAQRQLAGAFRRSPCGWTADYAGSGWLPLDAHRLRLV
jgi:hypothetical protein